jgi:hypothetical protein
MQETERADSHQNTVKRSGNTAKPPGKAAAGLNCNGLSLASQNGSGVFPNPAARSRPERLRGHRIVGGALLPFIQSFPARKNSGITVTGYYFYSNSSAVPCHIKNN